MKQQVMDYQMAAERYIRSLSAEQGNWLTGARREAAWRLGELGFPHKRMEAWRYTSVDRLLEKGFELDSQTTEFNQKAVLKQFLAEPVSGRLVFVDGMFQYDLSDTEIKGVTLGNLRGAMSTGDEATLQALGSLSGMGHHGFAALNLATMQDGAVIRISRGVKLDQPIELLHIATEAAAGQSLRPRHLIMVEADASARLIERYTSLSDVAVYFNNLVSEIQLAENASLQHERIQQEGAGAFHLSELYLELQADAQYQGVNASIGASWSRTTFNSRFLSPGASCELDGFYAAGQDQLVDYHLDVDHAVPGCNSRETFKGILFGNGRGVFDGRILVQKQAQKTDAHLANANLMLSRHAEIDTKPQLEIYADDVQCSHGTTVGQLDEQALFYLRSRGLTEDKARRLLCLGFAGEIIERFQSESVRQLIQQTIHRQLNATVSAQ